MTPESAAPTLAPTLIFTDAAAAKVGELIREEANPNLKLRVFVQGGGCSGFQYGFTFDENTEEGDTRVENGGVTLLIDPMSIQYLAGAEIDYREDIEGAQFVIRNPNASTTCGCGSSFSMCDRSRTDDGYPRYPRLPVLECRGHEPLSGDDGPAAPAPRDAA